MAMESRFTWMDGRLLPTEQATVPFLTAAMHYGLAVFEGIRVYETARGPAVFRLREHLERLLDSARVIGLECPYDVETITRACLDVVAANGFRECYLRPLVFATTGGWNLSVLGVPASVGVAAWEWKAYLGPEARARGVRMNVSSFTRHHPNVSMTKAKVAGNYVNSTLAKTESVRLGFDDAIMLDPQGYVAECTGQNLFLVRKGKLSTPGTASVLEGITRDSIQTLAGDLGYPLSEGLVSRDQLYLADEVFVVGTASEVNAVREIDGRKIGTGALGPVTRALQDAYHSLVRGEHARSEGWLTYVPAQPSASVA
jgi:branched-chain amino acid aminotransferase